MRLIIRGLVLVTEEGAERGERAVGVGVGVVARQDVLPVCSVSHIYTDTDTDTYNHTLQHIPTMEPNRVAEV